jgi:hypothetical protein
MAIPPSAAPDGRADAGSRWGAGEDCKSFRRLRFVLRRDLNDERINTCLLGCRPPDPLQDGGPISFRRNAQRTESSRYPDISHPWRNLSHLRENLSHPCRNDSAVGGSGCHPWRNCSHLDEKCCHRGQISSHLWEEDSAIGENGCHPREKGSAAGHKHSHARGRF